MENNNILKFPKAEQAKENKAFRIKTKDGEGVAMKLTIYCESTDKAIEIAFNLHKTATHGIIMCENRERNNFAQCTRA